MHVICCPTNRQGCGFDAPNNTAEICMESSAPIFANYRDPLLCREDNMGMETDVCGRHQFVAHLPMRGFDWRIVPRCFTSGYLLPAASRPRPPAVDHKRYLPARDRRRF